MRDTCTAPLASSASLFGIENKSYAIELNDRLDYHTPYTFAHILHNLPRTPDKPIHPSIKIKRPPSQAKATMSSGMMETEAGGEQTQYEAEATDVKESGKSTGQLGDPADKTTEDPANTSERAEENAAKGEKNVENIR